MALAADSKMSLLTRAGVDKLGHLLSISPLMRWSSHLLLITELRNSVCTCLWRIWNIIKTSADWNEPVLAWRRAEREGAEGYSGGEGERERESGRHNAAMQCNEQIVTDWSYVRVRLFGGGTCQILEWKRVSGVWPACRFQSLHSRVLEIRGRGHW